MDSLIPLFCLLLLLVVLVIILFVVRRQRRVVEKQSVLSGLKIEPATPAPPDYPSPEPVAEEPEVEELPDSLPPEEYEPEPEPEPEDEPSAEETPVEADTSIPELDEMMKAAPTPAPKAEEDESHQKAKRLARVLVQEIKMYHAAKVEQGVADGNLLAVLDKEIQQSRTVYDTRTPEEVRKNTRYFDDALTEILADGMAGALGDPPE
jgi:outer membrane biosynthesis protein TonB